MIEKEYILDDKNYRIKFRYKDYDEDFMTTPPALETVMLPNELIKISFNLFDSEYNKFGLISGSNLEIKITTQKNLKNLVYIESEISNKVFDNIDINLLDNTANTNNLIVETTNSNYDVTTNLPVLFHSNKLTDIKPDDLYCVDIVDITGARSMYETQPYLNYAIPKNANDYF